MKIKVTKPNILNAVRKDSHRCMIADAIHQCDPEAKYVSVDIQQIQWSNLRNRVRYFALTPPKAQLALLAFDSGRDVKPFEFTIHDRFLRQVGWHGDKEVLKKIRKRHAEGKSKKQTKRHYRPRRFREFGLKSMKP